MLIMHWVINHFIVIRNIFDVIEANYVTNEPTNPSSHNIVLLSITSFINDILFVIECSQIIYMYVNQYAIDIDMGVFRCSNNKNVNPQNTNIVLIGCVYG